MEALAMDIMGASMIIGSLLMFVTMFAYYFFKQ